MSTTSSPKRRPLGQPPGHDAVAEPGLNHADERVAAEDVEAREVRIIGVGRMTGAAASEPRRARRQIDLDQISPKIPAMSVRLVSMPGMSGSATSLLMSVASSGFSAHFLKNALSLVGCVRL